MRKSSIFVPSVDSDFDFTSNHPGPAFFAASLKLASLLGSNPWPFLLSWFASGMRRSAAMSTLNHIELYISLHFHKAKCFSMSMSFMRPDLLDSPQIFSFIWFFLDSAWRLSQLTQGHSKHIICAVASKHCQAMRKPGGGVKLHLTYYLTIKIISKILMAITKNTDLAKPLTPWCFQFLMTLSPAPMVAPNGGWTIAPPGAQCPPSKATFCLPSISQAKPLRWRWNQLICFINVLLGKHHFIWEWG